jgi:hypothetical protein
VSGPGLSSIAVDEMSYLCFKKKSNKTVDKVKPFIKIVIENIWRTKVANFFIEIKNKIQDIYRNTKFI